MNVNRFHLGPAALRRTLARALVVSSLLAGATTDAAAPDELAKPPDRPTGPVVVVSVPTAEDGSGALNPLGLRLLRHEVGQALRREPRINADVRMTDKGAQYGVWLRVMSVTDGKQGDVNLVLVKCQMTLVALPSKALRLSSSATAGTGLEGEISSALREELIADGLKACAPELAKDFVDYALPRAQMAAKGKR